MYYTQKLDFFFLISSELIIMKCMKTNIGDFSYNDKVYILN